MIRFLPVEWHDELPSTNTHLIERVKSDADTPSGAVVAARMQTAGRGRQARRWNTAPGQNLTFSFLWNAPVPPAYLPSMAQAISVGIARFLERQGVPPAIKWPNDVLAGGKKIAGILCERAGDAWIAGIGLNVNMTAEAAAAIDQPATSLAIETGRAHRVDEVLERLLGELQAPLAAWATGGFAAICDAYAALSLSRGAAIRVRDGEHHVEGTLLGFSAHGGLRLGLPDGSERLLYSGDVHPAGRVDGRGEA